VLEHLFVHCLMPLQLNLNLGGKKAVLAKGVKGKAAPTTWLGRLTDALNPAKWLAPKTAIDTGEGDDWGLEDALWPAARHPCTPAN
jgi:hypothetical protein